MLSTKASNEPKTSVESALDVLGSKGCVCDEKKKLLVDVARSSNLMAHPSSTCRPIFAVSLF